MNATAKYSLPCPAHSPSAPEVRPGRAPAVAVLLIGAFLPPLDFCIVNLALPAIREGLRASGGQLQLVISCYASAYAVFLITGGRLGDLFGRKSMFMAGIAGFILASLMCGIAPNGSVLILVTPEQAGLATGVVTSILQIGAAVGVAAVGSVFFTVLGDRSTAGAYGNAFACALAVAAGLQVIGMILAMKLDHRHRRKATVSGRADSVFIPTQ
jgi:MFS family permease